MKITQFFASCEDFNGVLVPNWILRRQELSPGAKLCYAKLCQTLDKEKRRSTLTQKVLAKELGFSLNQVGNYLRELEKCGLLFISRNNERNRNFYYLFIHEWFEDINWDKIDKEIEKERRRILRSYPKEERQRIRKLMRKIENYFKGNYLAFYQKYLPDIKQTGENEYATPCPFCDNDNETELIPVKIKKEK